MLVLFYITEVKMSDYPAIQELVVAPYLTDLGKKQDFYFFALYSFYFFNFL